MDLSYTPEYEAFRKEVRTFLRAHWSTDGHQPGREREREFRRRATEAGYLYRGVPRRYGGSEQAPDVVRAEIIREEFKRARAPLEVPGSGVAMLVPTLLECGSEAQKEFFIPKTITGEYIWAQGYSEPGAGSDLASLRTRAELKDGKWVINGQKIWTTMAQIAHYMFILVRTEPQAPKHSGISYLLLDLKQPGITIRPLKQMTGESEFCEVFFDDATTPAEWLVGERGMGWTVSKSTLKHERSSISGAERMDSTFRALLKIARECEKNGRPAIEDPQVRERLASIAGYIESIRYSGYRQLSMGLRNQDPGIFPLLGKLTGSNINQEMARLARDLIGDDLLLAPPVAEHRFARVEKKRRGHEQWVNHFMSSLALAIAGGTSNVQRNIIAERGLGLPRGGEGKG